MSAQAGILNSPDTIARRSFFKYLYNQLLMADSSYDSTAAHFDAKSPDTSLKLLVCGDIHGTRHGLRTIQDFHRELRPDLTIICGDITNFGDARRARKILDALPGRVMAVPGNCDPPAVLDGIDASGAENLHDRSIDHSGFRFAGMGGAPRRYGTPFELDDDSVMEMLARLLDGTDVLVLHAPPYGHVDIARHGEHLGSHVVADFLNDPKYSSPRLVLSAHVHESRGIEKEGGTTFINPGPAKNGCAALVNLDRLENLVDARLL